MIAKVEMQCQEIKNLLHEYDVIVHTNSEADYDYLDEDSVVMEVVNPYRDANLYIQMGEERIVSFARWHSHYSDTENSEFVEDINAIVQGKVGIINIFVSGKLLGCCILRDDISHFTKTEELISKMHFPEEHLQRIKSEGAVILVNYWLPNDCYEFDVDKEGCHSSAYYYPRRYGVRFILENGNCIGSASQKMYDEKIGFLDYVYVEEREDLVDVEKEVIGIIEDDLRRAGFEKVFTNIEKEDYDFYKSLGYEKIPKINNKKVHELCGARVRFDMSVMKEL